MNHDPNPVPVQKAAFWAKRVWVALLGAGLVLEAYGLGHPGPDDTLSETTRWMWRTDTRVGRWLFGAFWVVFSVWFLPHIVKVTRTVDTP